MSESPAAGPVRPARATRLRRVLRVAAGPAVLLAIAGVMAGSLGVRAQTSPGPYRAYAPMVVSDEPRAAAPPTVATPSGTPPTATRTPTQTSTPTPGPSPSPSPTLSPTPTTTPPTTGVIISSPPHATARGHYATIGARTQSGASCSIIFKDFGGHISPSEELKSKKADSDGFVGWSWQLAGSTPVGTGTVTVTCGSGSKSVSLEVTN